MRHAMIMAGGAGTRLWPVSRAGAPKQLTPLIRSAPDAPPKTLLEIAAERLEGVVPAERRFICTNERHRDAIHKYLPAFPDANILGEPALRDTVNAVALTAAVLEKQDPDGVFAVLTADHLITPQETFAKAVALAFELVEEDPRRLATFAITPTFPATGYGYLKLASDITPGAKGVDRFIEKPDLETATSYLSAGGYAWNSGMFVFQAKRFLELYGQWSPTNLEGIRAIQRAWGTPDQAKVLGDKYPVLDKTSVDYAIMEPASENPDAPIVGVTLDVTWLDVGSWPSYAETLEPDADNNRVAPGTNAVTHETSDCLVLDQTEDGHTIAMLGCEGLTVVRTPNETLIMPSAKAEGLKALHGKLADELK